MRIRTRFNREDDLTRRDFLRGAAASLLGVTAAPILARAAASDMDQVPLRPATARQVIYLYMSGGMSQLDTFDPKPGQETQGPTEVIGTNVDGIRVAAHFPRLAQQMDKVALIRSLRTTQGAHAQGRYYMHTSYELRGTIRHPSLGAWLNRMRGALNPQLPGHVAIGAGPYTASAGFFESSYVPLPIGDPTVGLEDSERPASVDDARFARRLERLAEMNREFGGRHGSRSVRAYSEMYDQAARLMGSRDLAAFDLEQEDDRLRDAYGDGTFGQGCLLARRLVEHGVRFVEVVSEGWDTHNQNFEAMEELCPPLDQTVSTLLADLDARGLLDETLVVLATEFGRTPRIVAERLGRNHHPQAFTCLMAGGGVRGGQVYGETNETGEEIAHGEVDVKDFNATIAYALGLPNDHELFSPSGRPFTVADRGTPVTDLF